MTILKSNQIVDLSLD